MARADAKPKPAPERTVVASNRKALHRYVILEKCEAGIVLTGPEVKSLRGGRCIITEAFARARDGAFWLLNMDVGAYQPAFHVEQIAKRPRKLLLHAGEFRRLERRLDEQGTTLVPLAVYFVHGLAKVELALARGAREYDRRERSKERDARREMRARMQKQPRGKRNTR
jgi:SsrA-binding protein